MTTAMAAAEAALLLALELTRERDVVRARQRARQLAAQFHLDVQAQTRFATAVSEIARCALGAGKTARVEYAIDRGAAQLVARVTGGGLAIADDGSPAFVAARRLSDRFILDRDAPAGPTVLLAKQVPPGTDLSAAAVARASSAMLREQESADDTALAEVQQQNRELVRLLGELEERQLETDRLAQELEETNRGVVALYAELDERAGYLERVNELKTRFLSDLNHEIRTPLNAVRNVARLLLDGYEGALNERQRRAVEMLRASTDSLSDLVNDWLDLARIEAGKTTVHNEPFTVSSLFGALRAMFRPLVADSSVDLVVDEPRDIPPLHGDEPKVAQILRNFVSNALKFTERGMVRLSASPGPGDTVRFDVADTGIGIESAHLESIFEEFSQVDSAVQRRVRGTGLGLPLSRRLARLLGGDVSVSSVHGEGSTFTLVIPRRLHQLTVPVAAPDTERSDG